MAIIYRLIPDTWEVQTQNPDGTWVTPILNAYEQAVFDKNMPQWDPLVIESEKRTGVPWNHTKGTIFGESKGISHIVGHDPGGSLGLGLMQITAQGLKKGHSDAEVMEPELNIQLGTDFMASNIARLGGIPDLPQMASMFNCGPAAHGAKPMASGPWGFCEFTNAKGGHPYISEVVAASNYALLKGIASSPPPAPDTGPSSGSVIAGAVVVGGGLAFAWVELIQPWLARRRVFA